MTTSTRSGPVGSIVVALRMRIRIGCFTATQGQGRA
jgi:hypothetical protein